MKEVVVISDPSIDVDKYGEISILDTRDTNPNIKHIEEVGSYSPYVDINGAVFDHMNINSFHLSIGSFLPSISISINDSSKRLQSYSTLIDVIIKVYVKSRNKDFKPIRQNYKVTDCKSYESEDGGKEIVMSGILFIESLHSDTIKSWKDLTSFEVFQKIAKDAELGFASNETASNDKMTRYCTNVTLLEFIKNDLSLQIYKDDDSFFKVFIDQYYYLNLVEVNQLISIKEQIKLMSNVRVITDDANATSEEVELMMDDFYLTDMSRRAYYNNYIKTYNFSNNIGSSINGYGNKLYLQYYDYTEREYKEFFINPLITEGLGDQYKPNDPVDPITKTLHLGEQFNDNVHANYYFAKASNELNNNNLNKFKLECLLSDINSAIRCYQIMPIILEEKDHERLGNTEEEELGEKKVVIDRYLSGFYVTTGIELDYIDHVFSETIICNRREFYQKQEMTDSMTDEKNK